MGSGHSAVNQYLRSLMQAFLATSGLVLLLIVYHLIIYWLEGGTLEHPARTLRIIAAFMYKQKEMQQLLFAVGVSFLLINFAPQRIKSGLYRIFIFIVSLWVFYRTFNLVHVYYAGSHLGKDFIAHIDKSSVSMMSDIKALLLFFIIPVPVIFTMHLLFKKLDFSRFDVKMKGSALLVLFLIFYSITAAVENDIPSYLWMSEFRYYYPAASQVPERYLASSFKKYAWKANSNDMQETLPVPVKVKLKDIFGLHINEKDALPLSKEHVFKEKFPYPGVTKRNALPNIILIAAEGLSSKLLGYYGSPHRGISPEIDSFAKESLVINPFYNSSFPTINGLVSMICSHYPVTGHEDWMDNKGAMKYDLLCLPEVLKERGYHSYNIVPGDPYFANQSPFMKANGMDEVYGALKMREVLREDPYGRVFQEKAYSDDQVMRSLIEGLKTGSFKEPFLVVLSTDDLHPPFRLPKDAIKYAQQENSILHIVHTTDAAFGRFWEYYKESAYSGNTIVILTADHALFPGIEYKDLTGDKRTGYYDEIPFIIHDPTHILPGELTVNSSSVDIVPSLLHLLDINIPNPFEGASVFDGDGRIKHRGVLGSHQYIFFFRVNNENSSFMQEDIKCDNMRNDAAQSSASNPFTVCDYRDWWRYKRWLVENNRIWREK